MLPRPARSATRTATPWPNPSTARTGPSSSGGASHSLTWPSWNWRRSGGSRGGTRSAFTRRWATGHRNRSKPSIMQAKRHKPSHYKKGNKNQATSLVWMSPVGQYHQKPKNSCRIIHPPPRKYSSTHSSRHYSPLKPTKHSAVCFQASEYKAAYNPIAPAMRPICASPFVGLIGPGCVWSILFVRKSSECWSK